MEFTNIKVSEIVFKRRIAERKYCEIFLVALRGKTCVMKVHHGERPKPPDGDEERLHSIYACESTAYRRLTKFGVCARGITPQFYGTIENINPALCLPHLEAFVKDEYPPTGIFLEYIPNMKELHFTNYTPKRMQKFIEGIDQIHKALVYHDDVYPRNMMIIEGDPERAVWIDFDRARTFDRMPDKYERDDIELERRIVAEMGLFMEADQAEGKLNQCLPFYY